MSTYPRRKTLWSTSQNNKEGRERGRGLEFFSSK